MIVRSGRYFFTIAMWASFAGCIALKASNDKTINLVLEHIHNKHYHEAQTLLDALISSISPQQQRSDELKKRISIAQKEVSQQSKPNAIVPLVSFVIPSYNRAAVLPDVINSIYNQQLAIPFEVIVVDDASTDNSLAILQSYMDKYDNFFVYRNKINKKAPTTRNIAIAYARGKYIVNADSDDVFEPHTLTPMLDAMIKGGYDVALFQDLRFFNDQDTSLIEVSASRYVLHEIGVTHILKEHYLSPAAGNKIFTKESWLQSGGYLEDVGHDTWTFSFKLLANGYKAYIHPGSSYLHRLWSNTDNVWWHDYRAKTTSISPWRALLEHPEFWDTSSFTIIKRYDTTDTNFIGIIREKLLKKTITLIPNNQLQALLAAYLHENQGDKVQSLKYYQAAICNGLSHSHVYLRAARIALELKDTESALSLLKAAIEKKLN